MNILVTEREHKIYSQLVSLVKENDWNFFLGTLPFLLVTGSAPRGVGTRALFLQWRVFPLLPLVGGLGSSLGLDSPPEGFRSRETLCALG